MRLPSKPYSTLPIYSLGPGTAAKEEASGASAPADPEKNPFGSGHSRHSLRRKYVTAELWFLFVYRGNVIKISCFEGSVHYLLLPPGFLSTAVAAAKMAGHKTSRSCPRSSLRTGSPWRSASIAKSSSQRLFPPASAACAWPLNAPASIAKPNPSTCRRLTLSTSGPLNAPSTRCRQPDRLARFCSRLSQSLVV